VSVKDMLKQYQRNMASQKKKEFESLKAKFY